MAVSLRGYVKHTAHSRQVSEYPGKTEHYRMCLNIIANAEGEERPGIKTYLETGSRRESSETWTVI